MKKYRTMAVMLVLSILFAGTILGCDNRSQAEKDIDAAAAKVKSALK